MSTIPLTLLLTIDRICKKDGPEIIKFIFLIIFFSLGIIDVKKTFTSISTIVFCLAQLSLGMEMTVSHPKENYASFDVTKIFHDNIFDGNAAQKDTVMKHVITSGYLKNSLWEDVKRYMDNRHLAKLSCLNKAQMLLEDITNPKTGEIITVFICEETAPLADLFLMEGTKLTLYDKSFTIILDFINKIKSKKGIYSDLTASEISEHVCNLQKLASCFFLKRSGKRIFKIT